MSGLFLKADLSFKKRVKNFLYKPCREWLCGILGTLYVTVRNRKFVHIFVDNGVWIHAYKDGTVTDRHINYSLSLKQYIRDAQDYWTFVYQPKPGDVIIDVGAGKGDITIDNPDSDIMSSITNVSGGFQVKGYTLDQIFEMYNVSIADFVKMNIEGAEKMAIQGMRDCIKKTRYICISCHDFLADGRHIEAMRTKKFILEFLRQNGFKIISREDDKRPYIADQINAINENFFAVQK